MRCVNCRNKTCGKCTSLDKTSTEVSNIVNKFRIFYFSRKMLAARVPYPLDIADMHKPAQLEYVRLDGEYILYNESVSIDEPLDLSEFDDFVKVGVGLRSSSVRYRTVKIMDLIVMRGNYEISNYRIWKP